MMNHPAMRAGKQEPVLTSIHLGGVHVQQIEDTEVSVVQRNVWVESETGPFS